jgi:hypothetical protein
MWLAYYDTTTNILVEVDIEDEDGGVDESSPGEWGSLESYLEYHTEDSDCIIKCIYSP